MRFFIFVWIFVMAVLLGSYGFAVDGLLAVTLDILIVFGVIMAGILLIYFIWAISLGGKYCILFELDDSRIYSIRLNRQYTCIHVEKLINEYVSGESDGMQLKYAAELAIKVINSDFRAVSRINASERRNLIKLYGKHAKNRIFTKGGDFRLILGTISGNSSPQAKRKIKVFEGNDNVYRY